MTYVALAKNGILWRFVGLLIKRTWVLT